MELTPTVGVADIDAFAAALRGLDPAVGEAGLIDQVAALERAKACCAAAQARATAAFAAARRTAEAARGVPARRWGVGLGAEIALARRESPTRGESHLKLAEALVTDLPGTLAALERGETSEWRATVVDRHTAVLTPGQRRAVDAELAGRLRGLGDRATAAAAAAAAYRIDPEGSVERAAKAERDRRVSIRPTPTTMAFLTALLPVAWAVRCYAVLSRYADANAGNGVTRAQSMADYLVLLLTGQAPAPLTLVDVEEVDDEAVVGHAAAADLDAADLGGVGAGDGSGDLDPDDGSDANLADVSAADVASATDGAGSEGLGGSEPADEEVGGAAGVAVRDPADVAGPSAGSDNSLGPTAPRDSSEREPVSRRGPVIDLQLILTDATLFGGDPEPGDLTGSGPLPAALARVMLTDETARVFVRRLYADPATGRLVGMDSTRRFFPAGLRALLIARDRWCRTPFCGAPARHIDHVIPAAGGGRTELANGQCLCEKCNYTKEAPGWTAHSGADGAVRTIAPTGHGYESRPPPAPGNRRDGPAARPPPLAAHI